MAPKAKEVAGKDVAEAEAAEVVLITKGQRTGSKRQRLRMKQKKKRLRRKKILSED